MASKTLEATVCSIELCDLQQKPPNRRRQEEQAQPLGCISALAEGFWLSCFPRSTMSLKTGNLSCFWFSKPVEQSIVGLTCNSNIWKAEAGGLL